MSPEDALIKILVRGVYQITLDSVSIEMYAHDCIENHRPILPDLRNLRIDVHLMHKVIEFLRKEGMIKYVAVRGTGFGNRYRCCLQGRCLVGVYTLGEHTIPCVSRGWMTMNPTVKDETLQQLKARVGASLVDDDSDTSSSEESSTDGSSDSHEETATLHGIRKELVALTTEVRKNRNCCEICMDRMKDTAFPCGHQTCIDCYEKLTTPKTCPTCRAVIHTPYFLKG